MVRKILKWLGLGLGGLVVLLVVMSLTGVALPLGFLKGTIQNAVHNATGRNLVIDGEFGVVPGFSPVARVGRVTLSNPEGFENADMANIDSVSAQFHLLPLLDGRIHVGEIAVSGVDAVLEQNLLGQNNWTFESSASNGSDAEAETRETDDKPAQAPGESFTLYAIDGVTLNDIDFSYKDLASGTSQQIVLDTVILEAPANQDANLDLQGSYQSLPLRVAATAPALNQALGTDIPLTMDLDAAKKLAKTRST